MKASYKQTSIYVLIFYLVLVLCFILNKHSLPSPFPALVTAREAADWFTRGPRADFLQLIANGRLRFQP